MDNLKSKPFGEFAGYLRWLRKSHGYTQAQLAAFLHITPAAYGYYERGERQPSSGMILSLSYFYRISFHSLLYYSAIPDCETEILSKFSYLKPEEPDSDCYHSSKSKYHINTGTPMLPYPLNKDEWELIQFCRSLQAKYKR